MSEKDFGSGWMEPEINSPGQNSLFESGGRLRDANQIPFEQLPDFFGFPRGRGTRYARICIQLLDATEVVLPE